MYVGIVLVSWQDLMPFAYLLFFARPFRLVYGDHQMIARMLHFLIAISTDYLHSFREYDFKINAFSILGRRSSRHARLGICLFTKRPDEISLSSIRIPNDAGDTLYSKAASSTVEQVNCPSRDECRRICRARSKWLLHLRCPVASTVERLANSQRKQWSNPVEFFLTLVAFGRV